MTTIVNTPVIYTFTFNGVDGTSTSSAVPFNVPGIKAGDMVIQTNTYCNAGESFLGRAPDGLVQQNIVSTDDTLYQNSWYWMTNKGQDLTANTYELLVLRLVPVTS